MRRLLGTVLALVWLIPAFASGADSDAVLQRRLVGHWQEIRHIDCESHHQRMDLEADGSFVVRDDVRGCREHSFSWRGTWSVVNNKFRYRVTQTSSPDDIPAGIQLEDKIASVSDTTWVMIEESTGNKSIATRRVDP